MRRALTVVFVMAAIAGGQDVLVACGDKFFLVGRGDMFNRTYASLNPGYIVLYAAGTSDVSRGLRDARMPRHLGKAGHRVRLVTDRRQLDQILRSEPVDVVLTDLLHALDLQTDLGVAPSAPALLPIVGQGAPQRAVSPSLGTTLKTSDNIKVMLDRIEGLMKGRRSGSGKRS